MKKKILAVIMAAALVLALAACGGGNKKNIVGSWELTDGESTTFGLGFTFEKDGKLILGIPGMEGSDEYSDVMAGLGAIMSMKYKIKSDSVIEVTMSALMGLGGKETIEVAYSLDGDTLVFDGATYRRLKK